MFLNRMFLKRICIFNYEENLYFQFRREFVFPIVFPITKRVIGNTLQDGHVVTFELRNNRSKPKIDVDWMQLQKMQMQIQSMQIQDSKYVDSTKKTREQLRPELVNVYIQCECMTRYVFVYRLRVFEIVCKSRDHFLFKRYVLNRKFCFATLLSNREICSTQHFFWWPFSNCLRSTESVQFSKPFVHRIALPTFGNMRIQPAKLSISQAFQIYTPSIFAFYRESLGRE